MKDLKGYLERMDYSINKDEKLFFLDKINLSSFDNFVDFGGAAGDLIKKVQEYLVSQGHDLSNKYFYIVDNNPQMQLRKDLINCQRVCDLESFELGKIKKTLLILSSVCHELDLTSLKSVMEWANSYADTVIIRDMFFDKDAPRLDICKNILDKIYQDPKWSEMLELAQGTCSETQLVYEYFLKYTYDENWETEKLENYFCNHSLKVVYYLESYYKSFVKSYLETYILPYKKIQIMQEFNYELILPTHIKAILTRIREK